MYTKLIVFCVAVFSGYGKFFLLTKSVKIKFLNMRVLKIKSQTDMDISLINIFMLTALAFPHINIPDPPTLECLNATLNSMIERVRDFIETNSNLDSLLP